MSKKEALLRVKNDLDNRRCVEIHLIWSNGEKTGIGNPNAIKAAIDALKEEMKRQLNEL